MSQRTNESNTGIHLDFHTPEFLPEALKNFDADSWVENIVKAKVDYVNLFAKCHYGNSYYNTKAGHKHSGLEVDMFGEQVSRLKAHGIKVFAYYSANTDLRAALEHPDWEQVDIEGKPLTTGNRWHDVCFNSPYFEQLMLPQIRELLENYEIDGLWLDMVRVMPSGCFCPHCRRLFEEQFGKKLLNSDGKYNEFRLWTLTNAMTRIRELVKSINPEVTLTANGAGTIADHDGLVTLSRRRGKGLVDYSAIEASPCYGNYYYVGFQSRYARLLGCPYELINSRFITHWGDWTMKPQSQLMYEAAIMLASGGRVCFGDQGYPDGTLQAGVYESLGQVFDYIANRKAYVEKTKTLADTAVLFTNGIAFGLRGADAICSDLNLQHDLIDEDTLTNLDEYRLLLIPEIGRVSKESLSHIHNFAHDGGIVLITGESAINNDFADIIGAKVQSQNTHSIGYLPAGIVPSPNIPLLIPQNPYEIKLTGGNMLIPLQLPSCEPTQKNFISHMHANPGHVSESPAVTINTVGKGKVGYVGFDMFSIYWEKNFYWLKNIFNRCIVNLGFEPLVKISAEGIIHSTLRKAGQELYLHMVCLATNPVTAGGYPPMEQKSVANNIKIAMKLKEKPKAVYLEPAQRQIAFDYNNGFLNVSIDRLELYEVLRICEK